MIDRVGDRARFPLNLWKIDEAGNISKTPVMTLEPMYYYESTGMFNIVLTEENVQEIYDNFVEQQKPEGDYDDLDALLEQEA